MLGFVPLSSTPLSAPQGVVLTQAASLGSIVSFGAVASTWSYTTFASSLGCIANFGAPTGVGNVYRPHSLGHIVHFGVPTTPGNRQAAAESLGYVAHFGEPIAIKFKRRAAA